MYSGESRNPWSQPDYTLADETHLDSLRKAIREQKILLEAAETPLTRDDEYKSVEELKCRIIKLSKELEDKKQMDAITTGRSHIPWLSRYQQNLRQLEDIADQKQTLQKELDYLVGTSIRNLQDDLLYETDRLNSAKMSQAASRPNNTMDFHSMTESDRIRAKAQAMVAARLNKSSSTRTASGGGEDDEKVAAQQRIQQVNAMMDSIKQSQREVEQIISTDLSIIDQDLKNGTSQLKDKQMFEQGLFVSDELAVFIDSLDRLPRNNKPSPPPPPPSSFNRSVINQPPPPPPPPPPPIPTSQRPGTPRSEADIKAEAYRLIEQRRKLFIKETVKKNEPNTIKREEPHSDLTNEEKTAQERMRQAEADARARLEAMREKRNKIRQEAAETEEKRQKAASEAAAAAEAEMMAEKKRKQQEEEERQARIRRQQEELEEKQRKQRLEEMQRLRKEAEEKEKKEAEERQKREEQERAEEEERQKKARQAAEQAAREKRLRREEIERREREMEAAKQEEINRRKRWEEDERQRQHQEQLKIQEKLDEEERIQKRIEEEEAAAKRRKEEEEERERQALLEEERKKKREEEENRLRKERKRREEEQKRRKEEEDRLRKEEEKRLLQLQREEEYKRAAESASTALPIQSNTTAGTSGYGVDVEDEVNFSIIYRALTLYEYQGIREDDLSFNANETIKAHPSKDKSSDWWYGTSLVTNQVGFFPRTYVEVVEEAFRVKTLYQFNKTRHDDLEFSENEVIIVQPFQDENSEWWYGTNEDTNESGYFPKTYVEKIDPAPPQIHVNAPNHTRPISIQRAPTSNSLTVVEEPQRGLSAPNTPIMKKTHLNVNKIDVTKRRRAASTVSSVDHSHISTPTLFPSSINNAPESLALLSWASTMDPIELHAIPPEERKRQEAIFELISTERSYLNDLQMIINIFYTDSGKYLTQDERDVVFSNIDDLLMCNTALLSDMESRQRDGAQVVDKIGDVFLGHADSLQCYSTYCRNQSYASKFLQKKREDDQWFEVFLKTAQTRPECRSLDLSHFLLQPVQRITRYPLLLRHILNSTPKRHPDYALVKSALSIAQKVLEDVNEETRRFENHQKMSELSRILDMEGAWRLNVPGREIVMDGALYKAKSGRKLHGYLFNDLLILAEPMKTLSNKGYLYSLYREPMPVGKITVRQQSTMTLKPTFGNNNSDDALFQIVYDNNIIAVKASSTAQKRQWISQIQHFSALQQYGA